MEINFNFVVGTLSKVGALVAAYLSFAICKYDRLERAGWQ